MTEHLVLERFGIDGLRGLLAQRLFGHDSCRLHERLDADALGLDWEHGRVSLPYTRP